MSVPYLIGIDPGETTGIVTLPVGEWPPGFIQCSSAWVLPILNGLTTDTVPVLCIERFAVSHRTTRSIRQDAGQLTRQLIHNIKSSFSELHIIERSAAEVKPWATDERLRAAGLWTPMRHARDAARHALFATCRDFEMPDPLSVKAKT